MTFDAVGAPLLGSDDILPVHEVNAEGRSPFLLSCDHYGRVLPRRLGDLGVAAGELTRHIAWDIGIAGVAERLARMLDAHLVAQRYSRLVIDCNRHPAQRRAVGSGARGAPARDFRPLSSPNRRRDR